MYCTRSTEHRPIRPWTCVLDALCDDILGVKSLGKLYLRLSLTLIPIGHNLEICNCYEGDEKWEGNVQTSKCDDVWRGMMGGGGLSVQALIYWEKFFQIKCAETGKQGCRDRKYCQKQYLLYGTINSRKNTVQYMAPWSKFVKKRNDFSQC